MLAFARRPMLNNNIPIDVDYDVYASDVNKINIEKAYRIAKTEKRRMKDSQKKIYDNLEKYDQFLKY